MVRLVKPLACAIGVAFLTWPAIACETPSSVLDQVLAVNPAAELHKRFRGGDALAFIDRLNAIPPVSDLSGDEVLIMRKRSTPYDFVAFFTDGCYSGNAKLLQPLIDSLLRDMGPGA